MAGCAGRGITPLNGPQPSYPYRAPESHSREWQAADSLWALRSDANAARRSLKLYRKATEASQMIPELWSRLSHACYYVAAYLETAPDKKEALFREGQDAAEKGMLLDPGYAVKFRDTGDETEAVRYLNASYAEVLFWYIANLGRELSQETLIIRRGNKDRVEALNKRLMKMDPTIYYAGPHRIAAILPIRLPEGNPAIAKAEFETCLALAPMYLGNRVAYAEFYAVRAKDKSLFQSQLSLVLTASTDTVPEIAPENRIAQEQAKALLARTAELFK